MTETTTKKDIQKLQRAIIDGLEDVKAQDVQVFDTEHLSPLFERVIMASGTSNRQTKALAASVRDKVREAGFSKPRIEGEDNGEWIIVDCGAAVAHVMQPVIRRYYNLEELWGGKPVRLKFGAPKPVSAETAAVKPAAKKASGGGAAAGKSKPQSAPEPGAKTPAAKKVAAKRAPVAAPAGEKRPAVKKAPASKTSSTSVPVKKVVVAVKKVPAKRSAPPAAPARKAPARKAAVSKS